MPVLTTAAGSVDYQLRRSTRAKRLQAVIRPDRVEVVLPTWAGERHVSRFLDEAGDWMVEKAAEVRSRSGTVIPATCISGAPLRLRGATLRLLVEPATDGPPRVSLDPGSIVRIRPGIANATEAGVRAALRHWLKEEVRRDAQALIAHHAPRLEVRAGKLKIKAQRTRWGSCGRHGDIHLNWRLVGAPPSVLEYLVVHELCHLRERNHGPRFWAWVERALPGYRTERQWLRAHGAELG